MNIIDCKRRKDPVVEFNGVIKRIGKTFWDRRYNGYSMEPGSSIRINNASKWITFRNFPNDCSYYHRSESEKQLINIDISEHGQDNTLIREVNKCSKNLQPVKIKWPIVYGSMSLDLTISVEKSNDSAVEFYVFENIDHSLLYDKLNGKGVELGPGNNPRLISNEERSVEYIEEYSLEAWRENYNKNKEDQGLWHLYKVAKAHELQYQDCSLDFVFGAHVFEHLINPIGHMEHWYRLLKKGGLVSHIIPNMRGSFEYRSWQTSVNEWIADYEADIFEPDYKHYNNYCNFHGTNPKIYFEEKRNIHYSLFSKDNLSWLLQYACDNLGYSNYSIQWSDNHFDVSFVLRK